MKTLLFALFLALSLPAAADDGLLKVVLKADKGEVALGDSVECSLMFYTTLNVRDIEYIKSFRADNAKWRKIDADTLELRLDSCDGRRVHSVELARYVLRPLKPGYITAKPVKIAVSYVTVKPDADPFEAFFEGDGAYEKHYRQLSTDGLSIKVIDD